VFDLLTYAHKKLAHYCSVNCSWVPVMFGGLTGCILMPKAVIEACA